MAGTDRLILGFGSDLRQSAARLIRDLVAAAFRGGFWLTRQIAADDDPDACTSASPTHPA
jgi:hypothetical protein